MLDNYLCLHYNKKHSPEAEDPDPEDPEPILAPPSGISNLGGAKVP